MIRMAGRMRGIPETWPAMATFLGKLAPPRNWLGLLALILLVSLSEGIGLFMLAPLLAALLRRDADAIPAADWSHGLPLPPLAVPPVLLTLPVLLGGFVGLVALRAALQHGRNLAAVRMERRVVASLRARLTGALLHARWHTAAAIPRGTIRSRLATDIENVGFGLGELVNLVAAGCALCAALAAAILLSPALALGMTLGMGVVLALHGHIRRAAETHGRRLSATYERFHGRSGEMLAALRMIKLHGRERAEAAAMADIEDELAASTMAHARATGRSRAFLQIGAAAMLACVVGAATATGAIPPITLLPLIAVFARTVPLLSALQAHWENWRFVSPALAATRQTIQALENGRERVPAVPPPAPPQRSIALRGATVLHADGRGGIQAIDCVLPIGSLTVLTGPSGAGKTTLADAIAGLTPLQHGELLLDDAPLAAPGRIGWRHRVAYVEQRPLLFNATIRDNLRWAAPGAGDDEIEAALIAASARFVFDWPLGLDTVAGDEGLALSGGQAARIAIARALLLRPALLILDEPTSALDPQNAAAVASAVAALRGGMTILVIAHGDELLRIADQRLCLEAGRLTPDHGHRAR